MSRRTIAPAAVDDLATLADMMTAVARVFGDEIEDELQQSGR